MQCPHCGYLMTPLDRDCARCKQRGFTPPQNAAAVPYAPGSPNPSSPASMPYPPQTTPSAAPPPANSAYTPPNYTPYTLPNAPSAAPYMPAPSPAARRASSSEPSQAAQILGGVLSVLLVVSVIALRVYLIYDREQRRQIAREALNQHYNETMRPQFDNLRAMEQQGRQHALEVGPRTIIVNQQPPSTVVNQPGMTQGELAAQQAQEQANQSMQRMQDMQQQNQQRMMDMQQQSQQRLQEMQQQNQQRMQQMQQNRPGFGGGFTPGGGFGAGSFHRPGFTPGGGFGAGSFQRPGGF